MVTAVGGAGVGAQILKALRLVDGYRIVGTDLQSTCVNFDLVDVAFSVPPATDPEYLPAVLAVADATGATVLFPGSEAELAVLSAHRETVAAAGLLLPIASRTAIEIGSDKTLTASFLDAHGFRRPRTSTLSRDQLELVDWFPVLVKPAVGSGGSADCHVAQDERELECVAGLLATQADRMMVQEYVGSPEAEYTVGVLHDLDGRFLNSIALRRELHSQLNVRTRVRNVTGRTELGDTLVISSGFSHGSVDEFREVRQQCEAIAGALGARGPINIQCRLVDGTVFVFEINPRFSGTTSLRAMLGYNEPDVLVRRHVLGHDVPVRFPYRFGTIHRSLTEHFVREEPARPWTELPRADFATLR
jgi:carbamoyl-phosphate synthase large subunit